MGGERVGEGLDAWTSRLKNEWKREDRNEKNKEAE